MQAAAFWHRPRSDITGTIDNVVRNNVDQADPVKLYEIGQQRDVVNVMLYSALASKFLLTDEPLSSHNWA